MRHSRSSVVKEARVDGGLFPSDSMSSEDWCAMAFLSLVRFGEED